MKHRMRNRVICGIITCSTTLCLGGSFIWDGGDASDDWAECENWQASACSGFPGYPSTTNDDATFSVADTVTTATVTIDDMVIADNVEFDGDSGAVLTVDSLTIEATGVSAVTLTVGGGLKVVADGTN